MNQISTNIGIKENIQLESKQGSIVEQKITQNTDAKYQSILYWKGGIMDTLPDKPNKMKPVEIQQALKETMNLSLPDSTYKSQAYCDIVFYNQNNLNSVDILRIGDNLWNLATPVFCDDPICSCRHIAQSDTRRLENIIKMFFEGEDWYELASFTFDHNVFEALLELGYK